MNCLVVLVDFVWLGNTQTPPQSSCGISEVSLKLPFFETHIMTGFNHVDIWGLQSTGGQFLKVSLTPDGAEPSAEWD